jgi:hypothetical protein
MVYHFFRCARCYAAYLIADRELETEGAILEVNPCKVCDRGKGVIEYVGTTALLIMNEGGRLS